MHTAETDTSLMTNVDDIDVSSLDYKQEVTVSLNEAKKLSFGIRLVSEDNRRMGCRIIWIHFKCILLQNSTRQ